MRIHLLLTVLFFLPAHWSFSQLDPNPIKLTLSAPQERLSVHLEKEVEHIELCGLLPGETYTLRLTDPCGGSYQFLTPDSKGKEGTSVYQFTANGKCAVISVAKEIKTACGADASLSVSCTTCEVPKPSYLKDGPILTNPGVPPQSMVTDVFVGGGCYEVMGATHSGGFLTRGTFSGGDGSIGLMDGIILSTGPVTLATGPNNVSNAGGVGGGGSDPDLAIAAPGTTIQDASILEFDFTPTEPQITFRYVFASEEYCEYVNSQFNDVFGFFLSGPGINGPYSNNGINIATLPNGTEVEINTVNHLTNQAFYVPNIPAGQTNCNGHPVATGTGPQDCQYDGFTVILTAVANVIPCETYHIKLAIGDGGDNIYDSAVFLESNSFDAGGSANVEAINPPATGGVLYEGCSQSFITFSRTNQDASFPLVVNFILGGTATPGADYTPIPGTVVIPPGQLTVTYPITAFEDFITEGVEYITIELVDPCNCSTSIAEIPIQDVPPLNVELEDITVCQGLPIQIIPTITGGVPNFSYQWSNGSQAPFYQGIPTSSGPITLTVTDYCGQMVTATANITVYTLEATIEGTAEVCPGGDPGFLQVSFTGDGPWSITYTIDGANPTTVNNITQNPYQLQVTEPGVYQIIVVVEDGACIGFGNGSGIVEQPQIDIASLITPISCYEEADGAIDITPSGGAGNYTFNWSNSSVEEDQFNLSAGSYSVTVTDADGCFQDTTIQLNEPPELVPTIVNTVGVDCDNPQGGSIDLEVNGGTGPYAYLWSNGDTAQDPDSLSAGVYEVVVTDANGCTATAMANVPGDVNIPLSDIEVVGVVNCVNTLITLDGSNSSAGPGITYAWSASGGGAIVSNPDSIAVTGDGAGSYVLTVLDTVSGCFSTASVIVQPDLNQPIAIANAPDPITCVVLEVQISSNGSSAGPDISYEWSTTGGNIVSDNTLPNAMVDAPGSYTLIVTDNGNGCTDTATVIVNLDADPPVADAGSDGEIDCAAPTTFLNGSGSSQGPNFIYLWTTSDGHIVGDSTLVDPEVDLPGTYTLTVTNTDNGCVSTDEVTIIDSGNAPNVSIATPDLLTCAVTEVTLDGSASDSGPNFSYLWTSVSGGTILQGADSVVALVDGPGVYELLVTNGDNGCFATQEITVGQDIDPPVADAGQPDTLSCLITSVQLDASGSSQGPNFTYFWSVVPNTGGVIDSGADTQTPVVSGEGVYQLTVTNTGNGCSSTSTVEVFNDSESPEAVIPPVDTLNCQVSQMVITGIGSSLGPNFQYQWTTNDGNIVQGATTLFLTLNAPGTYQLTVSNNSNGCVDSASIFVPIDTAAPVVVLPAVGPLTCVVDELNLDATGSDLGPSFLYNWSTLDGNIVGPNDSPDPLVDAPGTYTLQVTNAQNFCSTTASVTVGQDILPPDVEAGVGGELNCGVPSITLDGSGSSSGPDFSYQWVAVSGNILNGSTTPNPEVDAAGVYELTVTNNQNGCEATDQVTVTEDYTSPTADAGTADLLTCAVTETPLDGSGSAPSGNISYAWTPVGPGSVVSGANTAAPVVDQPGLYQLVVQDLSNFCTDTAFVQVDQDIAAPTADAGPSFELDCGTVSLFLDATNSSAGPIYTYAWSTLNGNLIGGISTLTPEINTAGVYTLTVTNTQNGCTATDQVTVTLDADAPIADAGPDGLLTCAVTETTLDGSASSQGLNFSYAWTVSGAAGNIVSGANTLNPVVDAPGVYQLTVTNLDNNCQTLSLVTVNEDVAEPNALADAPDLITCTNSSVQLTGAGSSAGPGFTYVWTTTDGSIVSGPNTLNPTVDAPGTYVLEVLNTANGCINTASATVGLDITPPDVSIAAPPQLNCTVLQVPVDGSASSGGPGFVYQWTTSDGVIVSGSTSPFLIAGAPGMYTLEVLNQNNGCTAQASMTVTQDIQAPQVEAGADDLLTCAVTALQLDGSGSDQGPNFSYQWDGPGVVSGANTLAPTIDEPGIYQLTVTNEDNNCTSTDAVEVLLNNETPTVVIALPAALTCLEEEVVLNAQGSDAGPDFELTWTTANGNISNDDNPVGVIVDAPGVYTLTILDMANGCTASQAVTVTENIELPGADAGPAFILNCNLNAVNLQGSVPGGLPSASFQWTTTDGNITGGANTASPLIDAPGTYVLEVTNNLNGCSSSDEVVIVENNPESFVFDQVNPVCNTQTGSIHIEEVTGGVPPYEYSIDGGFTFSGQSFFPALGPGVYDLVIQDANGCPLYDETLLPQSDEVLISLERVVTIPIGESYQIQALVNLPASEIASVTWTPSDGLSCDDCLTPMVTPEQLTNYVVTVTSLEGCSASAPIQIRTKRDIRIYIPTAFSPDGDGDNDVFLIFAGPEVAEIRQFRVFNRWGEAMFQNMDFQPNNPAFGWDGTHRGKPLDPAVFTWFAEIEYIDGEVEMFKGDVTLVK